MKDWIEVSESSQRSLLTQYYSVCVCVMKISGTTAVSICRELVSEERSNTIATTSTSRSLACLLTTTTTDILLASIGFPISLPYVWPYRRRRRLLLLLLVAPMLMLKLLPNRQGVTAQSPCALRSLQLYSSSGSVVLPSTHSLTHSPLSSTHWIQSR